MNCEVVQEKLSCYLDGVVDEATMEMIEDHLSGCSECRAELEALQALTVSLAACEVEPPSHLKLAIHDAIDQIPAVTKECETVLASLSEMVDGVLGEDDSAAALRHVAVCDACAHEYAMMQRTVSAVASVGVLDPPLDLKRRIAAAIAKERRLVSPLSVLAGKVRDALQPAGPKWVAGTAVTAALLVMLVAPAGRQNKVVTSPEPPKAVAEVNPAAPAPVEAAATPDHPVTSTAAVEAPVRTVTVAARRETRNVALVDRSRQEPLPPASSEKEQTPGQPAPVVAARAEVSAPAVPAVSTSTNARESTEAHKDIAPQAPSVTARNAEETRKEIIAAAESKPAEVQVAAQEPMVPPQDDRAVIRSLQQQIRMKKKVEGISVDILDMRF